MLVGERMKKLSAQQIGRCGELLVQYKLLLFGIEASRLPTDSGIDLVGFSNRRNKAITIQVKSNLRPKPGGGGKGKLHLDWWIPEKTPAELIALTDLERQKVWLFKMKEIPKVAQQNPKGRYHFFMAVDPTKSHRKDGKPVHEYEFEKYLLENQVHKIF